MDHQDKSSIKFCQKKIASKHFYMQIIIIKCQLDILNLGSIFQVTQNKLELLICMICNLLAQVLCILYKLHHIPFIKNINYYLKIKQGNQLH